MADPDSRRPGPVRHPAAGDGELRAWHRQCEVHQGKLAGGQRAEFEPAPVPELVPEIEPTALGSNNWAIAPDKTTTGRAILANDPHRAHGAPSLRRFPVFAIAGTGCSGATGTRSRRGEIAVMAAGRSEDAVLDAVGPEVYTFEDLVRLLATTIGRRPLTVHLPPLLVLLCAKVVGLVVGDVLVTRDELGGLMAELVTTDGSATGTVRLSDWLTKHGSELGRTYASELARHYR